MNDEYKFICKKCRCDFAHAGDVQEHLLVNHNIKPEDSKFHVEAIKLD